MCVVINGYAFSNPAYFAIPDSSLRVSNLYPRQLLPLIINTVALSKMRSKEQNRVSSSLKYSSVLLRCFAAGKSKINYSEVQIFSLFLLYFVNGFFNLTQIGCFSLTLDSNFNPTLISVSFLKKSRRLCELIAISGSFQRPHKNRMFHENH